MSDAFLDNLLTLADTHRQAGNLEQAAQAYQQVLARASGHAAAHAALGDIALAVGQMAAAEMHFTAALKIDPSLLGVANNLAFLYTKTRRADRARDLLRQVIARQPD